MTSQQQDMKTDELQKYWALNYIIMLVMKLLKTVINEILVNCIDVIGEKMRQIIIYTSK